MDRQRNLETGADALEIDSAHVAGLPEGIYTLPDGRKVKVKDGGVHLVENGGRCGSCVNQVEEFANLVEIIGMKKAKEHISDADLILYMKEFGQTVSQKELHQVIPEGKKVLFVVNKIDLAKNKNLMNLPDMPEPFQNIPKIGISALENTGIDELRKMVINISIKDLDVSNN